MAHLRPVGNGWQMQFYLNGRRRTKQFPPGTPNAVAEAEKNGIIAKAILITTEIV